MSKVYVMYNKRGERMEVGTMMQCLKTAKCSNFVEVKDESEADYVLKYFFTANEKQS